MGIKERHEREKESVRRAILDAARDLFVSEGYANVSIRKIADRIEYSPAAIYGYFPSKDDIFFALAEEGFELLFETAAAAPESPDPVQGLESRLWAFYEFSKRHPEHFALMFLDRSVPRIRAHYGNFRLLNDMKERMADLVRRSIAAGAFPGAVEPRAAIRVLAAGLSGAAIAGICHRIAPGEDPDLLARDVIALMIGGLKAGVATSFVATTHQCPLECGLDSTDDPAPRDVATAGTAGTDEGVLQS
jgi:AcrR family transcriptional regulator